jgi:hypothetical protein
MVKETSVLNQTKAFLCENSPEDLDESNKIRYGTEKKQEHFQQEANRKTKWKSQ